MPVTLTVPTPLVEVRVQERHGPGRSDVVLVGQVPSESLGPGADKLGVDQRWLTQYRVAGSAGSLQVVPLAHRAARSRLARGHQRGQRAGSGRRRACREPGGGRALWR